MFLKIMTVIKLYFREIRGIYLFRNLHLMRVWIVYSFRALKCIVCGKKYRMVKFFRNNFLQHVSAMTGFMILSKPSVYFIFFALNVSRYTTSHFCYE